MRMRSADFSRFSRLHRSIQPCTLYFLYNSGLPSYKIVFIAKLWTTIPENKPRRCDLCGRVISDNIKHRLVECASTYSLKSDLLEDLYRNVSTEICNEFLRTKSVTKKEMNKCMAEIYDPGGIRTRAARLISQYHNH